MRLPLLSPERGFRLNHACLTGHRPRSPTLMGRQLITFFFSFFSSFFFFFIPCALSIWPVRALLNQSKSPLHRWLIRNAKSQNPSSWSLLLQSFLNWQQPAQAQNWVCGTDCVSERERDERMQRGGEGGYCLWELGCIIYVAHIHLNAYMHTCACICAMHAHCKCT